MSSNVWSAPEFNDIPPKPRSRPRFPLVGLLMSVALIAVLIALFLPAIRTARPAAFRMQCSNNLKQIGLALLNYESEHKALPPAYTVDASGRPLHSWRTLILPYMDEERLYRTIDLSKPWDDPANAKALGNAPHAFRCPATPDPQNKTTYLASAGPDACLMPGRPRRLEDITDGASNTLMVIEVGVENAVPWMAPVDAGEDLVLSLGPNTKLAHRGGVTAGFVDGSVKFLKASISAPTLRALRSVAGHEKISADP
jgi:prepilin-type processing-associated H-X9-DG protein